VLSVCSGAPSGVVSARAHPWLLSGPGRSDGLPLPSVAVQGADLSERVEGDEMSHSWPGVGRSSQSVRLGTAVASVSSVDRGSSVESRVLSSNKFLPVTVDASVCSVSGRNKNQ
jgi:hypothetical protein